MNHSSGAGFSEFTAHTVKFNFCCLLEGSPEIGNLASERVLGIVGVRESRLKVPGKRRVTGRKVQKVVRVTVLRCLSPARANRSYTA